MAAPKSKYDIPVVKVPKGATLKQIYKIMRERFTAADLAEFLKDDYDTMIPAEKVIAEMEAIHKKESVLMEKAKARKKRRK